MRGDNFLNGIKDEEDIMPFTIDFDVGFIATDRAGQWIVKQLPNFIEAYIG